jgi:hypothetical protein
VDASPKEQPQVLHLHRLAQEVVSASADCLERVLFFTLSGNDDDFGCAISDEQVGQHC